MKKLYEKPTVTVTKLRVEERLMACQKCSNKGHQTSKCGALIQATT
jgi:hypothetical protein